MGRLESTTGFPLSDIWECGNKGPKSLHFGLLDFSLSSILDRVKKKKDPLASQKLKMDYTIWETVCCDWF